jgi:hypothetical protein
MVRAICDAVLKGHYLVVIGITVFFGLHPGVKFNNDAGDFIPPTDPDRLFDEEVQEISQ